MLRITRIAILISFITIGFSLSYAQKPDTTKTDDKTDIKVLEERVKQNEAEIDHLLKDREERIENRINEFDDKLKEQKKDLKEIINDKIEYVKEIINLYVFLGGLILSLLVSTISFIGYRRIISTIRNVIEQKTVAELEASWADSFEEFSTERTKELEGKWESRLKDIEKKWIDYDQSLKKAMIKMEGQKGISSISEIPPEELNEFIDKLVQVKQEKEYSADDWSFKAYNEGQKGNHEKAIGYFNKAIEKDPKNARTYNNRGFSYNILKEHKKAIDDFNKAIELDPKFAVAYQNRGQAYISSKKYEKASVDLNVAIGLIPDSWYPLNALATVDIVTGNYEGALKKFEKALTLDLRDEASAILYYKKCIITKLLGFDTTEIEKVLAEALEKEFDLIRFYFDDITHWLSETDLPPDTRKFIEEKTEMLKKKMK